MGIVAEFRAFALKGSLIDVAVGIIIGAAVSDTVGALVESILTPIIGVFLGGVDFSALAVRVGEAEIGYGRFVQALIDFLIIALVLFLIVRALARAKAALAEPAPAPAPKGPTEEVRLLREIRDALARPPAG